MNAPTFLATFPATEQRETCWRIPLADGQEILLTSPETTLAPEPNDARVRVDLNHAFGHLADTRSSITWQSALEWVTALITIHGSAS